MKDGGGVNEEGVVSTDSAVGPGVMESGGVGEEGGDNAPLDGLRISC